jgi:hypothetical protein
MVSDPAGSGTAKQAQDGVRKAASALADAGYAVDEVEPPSIEEAAEALLVMLSTPGMRAVWQLMSPSLPPDTRRFMSAFFEVAGDPDAVRAAQRGSPARPGPDGPAGRVRWPCRGAVTGVTMLGRDATAGGPVAPQESTWRWTECVLRARREGASQRRHPAS